MRTSVVLLVLLAAAGSGLGDSDLVTQETELRNKLFESYRKEIRSNSLVNISIGKFSIQRLEMYEDLHQLEINTFLSMSWNDTRLTWDADQYKAVEMLHLTPGTVWTPDLTLYNGVDPERQLLTSSKDYLMLLYPSGMILHVPSVQLRFTCLLDLTYWPHDEHNCSLKIGSWTHSGNTLDLVVDETQVMDLADQAELSATSPEWEVKSATAVREVKYYPCCPEPYVNMLVTFNLRRAAPAYVWVVTAPVVCLILLSVVVFLLPASQAGVKVMFGGILLLFDLLFLIFVPTTVAHNPTHAPFLVKLVVLEMLVVSVSVVMSGIVARLAHSSPLPDPFRLLCLQKQAWEIAGSTKKSDEVKGGNGDKLSGQWLLLALLVHLVTTLIILISFGCVL